LGENYDFLKVLLADKVPHAIRTLKKLGMSYIGNKAQTRSILLLADMESSSFFKPKRL
jgi:hypothetical protein